MSTQQEQAPTRVPGTGRVWPHLLTAVVAGLLVYFVGGIGYLLGKRRVLAVSPAPLHGSPAYLAVSVTVLGLLVVLSGWLGWRISRRIARSTGAPAGRWWPIAMVCTYAIAVSVTVAGDGWTARREPGFLLATDTMSVNAGIAVWAVALVAVAAMTTPLVARQRWTAATVAATGGALAAAWCAMTVAAALYVATHGEARPEDKPYRTLFALPRIVLDDGVADMDDVRDGQGLGTLGNFLWDVADDRGPVAQTLLIASAFILSYLIAMGDKHAGSRVVHG